MTVNHYMTFIIDKVVQHLTNQVNKYHNYPLPDTTLDFQKAFQQIAQDFCIETTIIKVLILLY